MKKTLFALGLGLVAATVAIAAPTDAVKQLNDEIVRILAPFQNPVTKASMNFKTIKTDSVRALEVKLGALYRKIGEQNKLEVKIDDISYAYGNGKAPATKFRGSLGIDLTKLISQKDLNEIIPGIEQMIQDMAKDFISEYGDAATVVAKVTEKRTDAEGNYTSIKAYINARIDLSKLPAEVKLEDVLFTNAMLNVSLDVKKGAGLSASIISNPEYKGFREDQRGLKEMLDKLLERDPAQIKEIEDLFKSLDDMAGSVVNKK